MPTTTTKARPAPKRKPVRGGSSRPAGLFTWITIGVIVAVIIAILVVKAVSSQTETFVPTSPAIAAELTNVPASVFNAVGVTSPDISITGPLSITGQKPLNWKLDGKVLPTVYYYGAEFCPYCAAERWPMIIALSRFGTFTGLGNMESNPTDIDGNTPTFTLVRATYTSQYINFFHVEAETRYHKNLQTPTAAELANITKYDTDQWDPALPKDGTGNGSIPYVSFNNRFFIIGASYNPQALAGLSRSQIASLLDQPSDPLTKGIIVTANLITASVCNIDGQMPTAVCTSPGVRAADSSMRLKA